MPKEKKSQAPITQGSAPSTSPAKAEKADKTRKAALETAPKTTSRKAVTTKAKAKASTAASQAKTSQTKASQTKTSQAKAPKSARAVTVSADIASAGIASAETAPAADSVTENVTATLSQKPAQAKAPKSARPRKTKAVTEQGSAPVASAAVPTVPTPAPATAKPATAPRKAASPKKAQAKALAAAQAKAAEETQPPLSAIPQDIPQTEAQTKTTRSKAPKQPRASKSKPQAAVTPPAEAPAKQVPAARKGNKARSTPPAAPTDADAESVITDVITVTAAPDTALPTTESVSTAADRTTPKSTEPNVTELVTAQLRKMGRPVHVRDFERSFTRQAREKLGRDLDRLLEDLAHKGVIIRTRRNTYGLPEAMNLVRGRFQASSSGFGFVVPDSGGDDFYIREGETLEAWSGDTVLIRPEGGGGGGGGGRGPERNDRRRNQGQGNQGRSSRNDSPRAAVVRIVERAYTKLVGSLEYLHGYALLKADDHRARHRIMLVQGDNTNLNAGARVVAQLFWPEETGEDEVYGEVVQVLGTEDDPATETQAVIIKYGLHEAFAPEVLAEAEKIPSQVPESAVAGRLDLREYNIFTVDGSDAKDFDDAIHIQSTPEGNFKVGIHIADVSHYVRPGTALDTEAYDRATSVYLPGSVLPMLPEHLSNGVCSLVPYEDRLTMSAMIELSGEGEILNTNFASSVIRSKARLTYDEVQAYSEASATLPEHARALEGDLHLLLKLTAKLRQKRLREGSLDFKLREVKVDIGKDGHMQLIPLHEETARGMIEDLMLLANKAVAHFLLEKNVPTLYRIHEEPTLGRFQEASAAVGRMGLSFPGGQPTPQAYQAVLKAVRGTAQESVVNTVLLRSMQQAKYAEENLGHFGLAFDEYLHFTSPIRRYPDLLVHRALKLALHGEISERERAEVSAALPEQGRHTSERERNAAEAERDLTKYYQAKWAQEHLGEVFEGRVSGIIASGLFVALENGVEGRLHISNLADDYYIFIEEASILKGRSTGRTYRIGDTIQVNISKVNPLARQIDFAQENSMDGNEQKPRARRRDDRTEQRREKMSSFAPKKKPENSHEAALTQTTPQENMPTAQPQARVQQGARRDGGGSIRRDSAPRDSVYRDGGRSAQQSGYRRRVVTLERPRNEHLRPVNITVQRMYFGDWTLENMPPEENQGERSYRSGTPYRGRSAANGASRQSREGERARPERGARATQTSAPTSAAETGSSDEAKRRRRRRGRRGGSSEGSSNGNSQE